MIALVDYGAGNLASVVKALAHLGANVEIARDPAAIARADATIVPGVGHFAATAAIDAALTQAIRGAIAAGRPLLGICLGMQWLFEGSEEAPAMAGLGAIRGVCARLPGTGVKVPHVGWNSLALARPSWLLEGVADGRYVYFTHSFAAPITAETVASTCHGVAFASAVECGRIAGVQFHPEKSSDAGLAILRNFLRRAADRT